MKLNSIGEAFVTGSALIGLALIGFGVHENRNNNYLAANLLIAGGAILDVLACAGKYCGPSSFFEPYDSERNRFERDQAVTSQRRADEERGLLSV